MLRALRSRLQKAMSVTGRSPDFSRWRGAFQTQSTNVVRHRLTTTPRKMRWK
jgi:hypothetical protein